jgi:anti-sigma factor RsiW
MNSCDKIKKLAFLYNDHALESTQHTQVQEHLSGCPACRGHYAQAQQIRKSLQRLPKVRTAPDFNTVLRARLRSQSTRRPLFRFDFNSVFWRVPAYAGLALVFIAIGMMVQRHWLTQPLPTTMAENVIVTSTPHAAQSLPSAVVSAARSVKRPRVTNYVSEPVVPASDLKRWIRRNGLRGQGNLERLNGDSTGSSGYREIPQPSMAHYQEQF